MNLHTDIGNGILWTMAMYEEFLMLKMRSFVAYVGVDLELCPLPPQISPRSNF
jgi:hypothetical protein